MGKALVLKNVDFSSNKLATVTIGDRIPCTGLEMSDSTHAFTAIGATKTLTVIKTPSGTTDSVVWSTSDANVATVADGVVTCAGVGTATITAMCGNQTATCAITSTVTLSADTMEKIIHKENSGTDLPAGKDYIGTYGTESGNYLKAALYLSETATPTGYKALTGENETYDGKYPIMIPNNATTITIEAPNTVTLSQTRIVYINSTLQPTYQGVVNKGARAVTNNLTNSSISNNKSEYTIPDDVSGLDSFIFACRFSADISESPEGITVTFS